MFFLVLPPAYICFGSRFKGLMYSWTQVSMNVVECKITSSLDSSREYLPGSRGNPPILPQKKTSARHDFYVLSNVGAFGRN